MNLLIDFICIKKYIIFYKKCIHQIHTMECLAKYDLCKLTLKFFSYEIIYADIDQKLITNL